MGMKSCVILDVVADNRVDVLGEQFADLVLFTIDLVLYLFDAL